MKVKLFWQEKCPNCPEAKRVVKSLTQEMPLNLMEFNINDIEGMAEASFHGVMGTPTTIIVDEEDNEIISWRSQIPNRLQLMEVIQH